jgi:hypothetical protein
MKLNKLSVAIALMLSAPAFGQTVFEAPYGVQNEFPFTIPSSDGLSFDVDESDDGNDAIVLCNAGTEAESTNTYTDEGSSYNLVLSAAELQCETVTVLIDETVDTWFFIQTYGDITNARNQAIPLTDFGTSGGLGVLDANLNYQADVEAIDDDTAAPANEEAFFDGTGYAGGTIKLDGNVVNWAGTAVATPTVAGVPEVDLTHSRGLPMATCADTGFPEFGVVYGMGCAVTSYTHSTGVVVLGGSASFADNQLQKATILLCSTTEGCQSAQIASNLLSGDALTLEDPLTVDIEGDTITATIFGTPQSVANSTVEGDVNVVTVEGSDATTYFGGLAPSAVAIRTEMDSNSTDLNTIVTGVADVPTVAEFEARTLPTGSYFDVATDSVKMASFTNAAGWECTFDPIAATAPKVTFNCVAP